MNVVMVIYTIGRIRQPRTVAIVMLAWEKYRITIVFFVFGLLTIS